MAAAGPPPAEQSLVDFEADSEDLAWAGEAEAAAAQQQQDRRADRRDPAAAAAAAAARPPPDDAAPALPPHLAARLGGPSMVMPNDDRDAAAAAAAAHAAAHAPGPSRPRLAFEPARSADGWAVFATGLHPEAQEDDALDFFSAAGRVKGLSLGLARATGDVAGHALVEYADEEEARRAVDELDGGEFLGGRVRVGFAFVRPRGAGGEEGGGGGEGGNKGKGRWRGRGQRGGGGGGGGGGQDRRDGGG
jgi:RNA-binding protein 8A